MLDLEAQECLRLLRLGELVFDDREGGDSCLGDRLGLKHVDLDGVHVEVKAAIIDTQLDNLWLLPVLYNYFQSH